MKEAMESVTCNLCGISTETEIIEKFPNGISLVKCCTCGLIYQNPRPTSEELLKYYNEIHSNLNSETPSPTLDKHNSGVNHNRATVANAYSISRRSFFSGVLRKLEPLLPPRARVCDFGCGEGMLLEFLRSGELAKTSTYRLFGIEPSRAPAEEARKRGFAVFEGTLENYNDERQFDLILMNDVLEHLTDPLGTLRAVGKLLSPRGLIFVRVPNIDGIMLKARLMKKFRVLKRLQGSSAKGIWSVPDHTYNFSFDLLREFGEKSALSIGLSGVVPLEIYANDLRAHVARFLNFGLNLVYRVTGRSFNTAIYVVFEKRVA